MEKIIKSVNYDYSAFIKSIDLLCKRYTFLNKMSIGKSIRGRDIPSLIIGKTDDYALYCAAVHGSEHITTNIVLMWLEDICRSIETNLPLCGLKTNELIKESGIIIVPRVNPDGCEISINGKTACGENLKEINRMCKGDFEHFNANFRGVDINHNFDASWEKLKAKEEEMGIHFPSASRFGGRQKMSEPETLALVNLCKTRKIRHATALHSQGRVIYWTYKDKNPPHSRQMAEIFASTSGYLLDYPIDIASGGGFKDWFIKEFNRPGFTVEVGNGKNPLPINDAESIYNEIKKSLTISAIL
ncbi:MAG: M14 family metallocarboxypeptidase [Clostridia bacterium]|nr:M14 family metallocarboxypeptidase [Clostridia bacterium]